MADNFHVWVTPSGVKVKSIQVPGPAGLTDGYVQFNDDPPIPIGPNGLDLKAADQPDGDTWAVVTGQDDHGRLIKRKSGPDQQVRVLPIVHGRDAIWVTPSGEVSWVAQGGGEINYMDSDRKEPADSRHPLTPLPPPHQEVWPGPISFVVTNVYQAGDWKIGEDTTAPQGVTRIYVRRALDPVLQVPLVYTSRLVYGAQQADGSLIVAISLPGAFVHSDQFVDPLVPPVDPPPPPPDDEEPPVMAPPNHFATVRAINEQFPHLLKTNTRDTVREFIWRATWALHQRDPKWGFLTKTEGENHFVIKGHRVAVDAVTYQGWDGIVDIVSNNSAAPEPGGVSWGEDVKRPSSEWLQPFPFDSETGNGDDTQNPPPPPPPDNDLDEVLADIAHRLTSIETLLALAPTAVDFGKVAAEMNVMSEDIRALTQVVEGLEEVEFPPYRGTVRVLGMPATITLNPVE